MRLKKEAKIMLIERKIVQLLQEGKSKRAISSELKVGFRKIQKICFLATEKGYLTQTPLPPYPEPLFPERIYKNVIQSECDLILISHKDWIAERLLSGWHKISVFENLPVKVTRSSFYRFLDRHQLNGIDDHSLRVIPEIVCDPGESLQIDWGLIRKLKDSATGKTVKVWAFIGVLSYSRIMIVRLVTRFDVHTTLCSLEDMLRQLGGVPRKVTTDNPKCFCLEASNYEALINPAFERFAEHYQFRIECLPPRDPQKKGKVESSVKYLRRLCEPYEKKELDLDDFQDFINKKIEIANGRKHGTTHCKPSDVFILKEFSSLKPLPPLSYKWEDFSWAKVRKDGHVRFSGKYYSIGQKFVGQDAFIIGDEKQVSLYCKGNLIEVHDRITSSYNYKSTKKHHLKSWEQVFEDNSFYLKRAEKIGFNCKSLVQALLSSSDGFVDTRIVWGILSLDKEYHHDDIDMACAKALSLKCFSYRFVKNFIDNKHQKKEEIKISRNSHCFVRSISEYQQKIKEIHIGVKEDEHKNTKTTAQ